MPAMVRVRSAEYLREISSVVPGLSLFGSIARAEERGDSDIDLAAEFDPAAGIGLLDVVALERRLSEILGRAVDLLPEPVEKPGLQARIDRDRRRAF